MSISLEWVPGFDGGSVQTFVLEDGFANEWISQAVESTVLQTASIRTTITDLVPETNYTLRVYAKNFYGVSEYSDVYNVTTLQSMYTLISTRDCGSNYIDEYRRLRRVCACAHARQKLRTSHTQIIHQYLHFGSNLLMNLWIFITVHSLMIYTILLTAAKLTCPCNSFENRPHSPEVILVL